MSALTPPNQKYRNTWKVFGAQIKLSDKYKKGYDQIKWGDTTMPKKVIPASNLDGHYIVKFE
jgi:hypothetical protein